MALFSFIKNYLNLSTNRNSEQTPQQGDILQATSSAASTDPIAPISPVKPAPTQPPIAPVGIPQPQNNIEITATQTSSNTNATNEANTIGITAMSSATASQTTLNADVTKSIESTSSADSIASTSDANGNTAIGTANTFQSISDDNATKNIESVTGIINTTTIGSSVVSGSNFTSTTQDLETHTNAAVTGSANIFQTMLIADVSKSMEPTLSVNNITSIADANGTTTDNTAASMKNASTAEIEASPLPALLVPPACEVPAILENTEQTTITKDEAAAAEDARQRVLQAHPELKLSDQEQQAFDDLQHDQLILTQVRTNLAEQLLALLGVKCVAQLLQKEEAKDGMSLGLILCDNLDPRYIELIATQLYQFKLHPQLGALLSEYDTESGSDAYGTGTMIEADLNMTDAGAIAGASAFTIWNKLNLTITRKTLLELYDESNLPAYPWLVPDEQNATYWRNNKKAGQYNLCAITTGETEDTLGNIRTRITSDTLKATLAQKEVVPQLLALFALLTKESWGVIATTKTMPQCKIAIDRLQHDPHLDDLRIVLSQLIECFSLRPLNLSEFLAEVLIRYTLGQSLLEAMGQAICVLHYPSDSWLFASAISKNKKDDNSLKTTACKRVLEKMTKERPSLLDNITTITNAHSLEDFKFDQLLTNFNNLIHPNKDSNNTATKINDAISSSVKQGKVSQTSAVSAASEADAVNEVATKDSQKSKETTKGDTGKIADEHETEDISQLLAWESALCKHYLLSLQSSNELREQAFKGLCIIEWNAKLERFFNTTTPRAKLSLSERTFNMFNSCLTDDEALSEAEIETIKLVDTNIKILSSDERNQLNELYNRRRAIFSQESAISNEWEKIIYYKTTYNEPDFLMALSSIMLNLYHDTQFSHERLAKVELHLDVTQNELQELNYYVLSYFSLRYGPCLQQLATALKQRLVIGINGIMDSDAPNPILQFPAYFAYKQAQQAAQNHGVRFKALKPCLKDNDNNTRLQFTIKTYYQNQHSLLRAKDSSAVNLKLGRHFKLSWQLKSNSISYHFAQDLNNLLAAQTVQQGAFEHNTFAAQGTLQALNLADSSTFINQQGGEFVSFFKSKCATAKDSETSSEEATDASSATSLTLYDPCDLSMAYKIQLQALQQAFTSLEHFPENARTKVQNQIQEFTKLYQSMADCYLQVLQSIVDGTFNFNLCQKLSFAHTNLQYSLINCALCTDPRLIRDYPSLAQQVRELLFIVLRIGMAYTLSQPSQESYRYALATPFTVEALRSFASKCERVQNLIFNIFTTPLSFNDRDVFLNSLQQDLAYYDAPEICLSLNAFTSNLAPNAATLNLSSITASTLMPSSLVANSQVVVLLANQSLGGYTLYESEQKLQQDLGFTRKTGSLGRVHKRGRKSGSTYVSFNNGEGGGGGSSGVGGIGAVSEASKIYLEAILEQVRTYITLQPYPLNQCTVVLAHCSLPYFAYELYSKFNQELCSQFPDLHFNLLLLCTDLLQAQKLYQVFASNSSLQTAWNAITATNSYNSILPQLRVTILLEQQGNELKNGTLSDYVESISLRQGLHIDTYDDAMGMDLNIDNAASATLNAEREAQLRRFGHIGLMVHVFDAAAKFQFTETLYAAPLVQDEVNYQPTLINFSARHNATHMSRFMVCPTMPLSKIQYLHSLYYIKQRDITPFIQAQNALYQALTARAVNLSHADKDNDNITTSITNMPSSIVTPLFERVLRIDSADEDLQALLQQIHKSCDIVCYVDDLVTRQTLHQQHLKVIYQQKLHNHALNFMVATQSPALMANHFLDELTKSLGIYDEKQRACCLEALLLDAISLSGRLLMRAKLKRIYSYELMGVVLAHYLAHEMMQRICLQYSGQLSNTYETFIYLDDYRALFQAGSNSRNKQFADLLGMQIIRYPETEGTKSHRYMLNLMVLESKFLQQENNTAARESLNQTACTTNLLYRALQDQGEVSILDRATWLSRLANLWRENIASNNVQDSRLHSILGDDVLSKIQQQISAGQVDILLHGISLVFACKSTSAKSKECQTVLKPNMAQKDSINDFPILQIKLCHNAVMRVLEQFRQNLWQGQAKVLQELQRYFANETQLISDYLAYDSRICLQPNVLRSPKDPLAQQALAALDVPKFLQQQQTTIEQTVRASFTDASINQSNSNNTIASSLKTQALTPTHSAITNTIASANMIKAAKASLGSDASELERLQARLPLTFAQLERSAHDADLHSNQRQQWLKQTLYAFTAFCQHDLNSKPLILEHHLTPNGAVLLIDGRSLDYNELNKKAVKNSLQTRCAVTITALHPRSGQIEVNLAAPYRAFVYYRDLMQKRSFDYDHYKIVHSTNNEAGTATKAKAMVQANSDYLGFNAKFVLGMRESDDQPVYFDLHEDDPHLLIAGGTGSGKSVLIKLLLTDMVLTNTPQDLRLILVDPKMGNELQIFNELPHVMGLKELSSLLSSSESESAVYDYPFGLKQSGPDSPFGLGLNGGFESTKITVDADALNANDITDTSISKIITNESDCVIALQFLERLTKVRNEQFAKLVGYMKTQGQLSTIVKLDEYNKRAPQYDFPRLPRLFFVMDEFADWALDSEFSVGQESLRKIAQIGRSAGIHLILITQRPDREIIKGSIHNNFGSRIALKMNSIYDSKTILDSKDYNASTLQGNGHMICKLKNVGNDGYCSAQAGFISDLAELIAALKSDYQNEQNNKQ